jgi:hypothetical protein
MSGTKIKRKPLIATFLTCALLGPPVGGFSLFLAKWLRLLANGETAYNLTYDGLLRFTAGLENFFGVVIFFIIPFSFFEGGLAAIFFGFTMVAYGLIKAQPPLWFAIAVAFVGWLVLPSVKYDIWPRNDIMMAHILSAIVCWLVFRRYWNRWAGDNATNPSLFGKAVS